MNCINSPPIEHFLSWYQKLKDVSAAQENVYAFTLDGLYYKVGMAFYHCYENKHYELIFGTYSHNGVFLNNLYY